MAVLCGPIVEVLMSRGIEDPDMFIAPAKWDDLPSPFTIEGMNQAATEITKAVSMQQRIGIFGDYDCDGVLSTAILQATLRKLNVEPLVYLPHRDEGYGLINSAVHFFSRHQTSLLITIDNGINALGPVHLAQRLGIDVVVVDHHHVETRANTTAVWSPDFSAAGLALLLAWALLDNAGMSQEDALPFLHSLSRLAAIASIADCVPLVGATRTLTKIGLAELAHTRHAGLRKMLFMAGVADQEVPTSEQIAFRVAPRINAAGRVGHPKVALDMLNAPSQEEQIELALSLDHLNRDRRRQEKEALDQLPLLVPEVIPAGLVVYGPQWRKGIAGILASRVRERYGVPAFVLVQDLRTGLAVGSGRSIEGVSLIDALRSCSSVLTKFGGHHQAAGVTLAVENIPAFQEQFAAFLCCHPPLPCEAPNADANLDLSMVSRAFRSQLRSLEPFGIGNPTPLFRLKDVEVRRASEQFVIIRQRGRELKARCTQLVGGKGTAVVGLNGTSAYLASFS